MSIEISAALIGALSGGLVSFGALYLQDWLKAKRIADGLQFSISPRHGLSVRARVLNNSPYPIRNCWRYITLKYENDDIVIGFYSYINRAEPYPLIEDRLCWAIANNPPSIDICPGECQALNIADFANNGTFFGIVSEKNTSPYRVSLNAGKRYEGEIKIVNFDAKAKRFRIVIDGRDRENPIKLL